MSEDTGRTELVILKLPDGGYLVTDPGRLREGICGERLFASLKIDDALDYIRVQLSPEPADASFGETPLRWDRTEDVKND